MPDSIDQEVLDTLKALNAEPIDANKSFMLIALRLKHVIDTQETIVGVLNEHTDALDELGVKTTSIEELNKQTLEYSQAWAGDVKKVLRHLGIEGDTDI